MPQHNGTGGCSTSGCHCNTGYGCSRNASEDYKKTTNRPTAYQATTVAKSPQTKRTPMATCSQWSTEEESPSHPVPRLTPTSPSPTRSPPDRNKTKGNSIGQGEPVDGGGASDLGAPNLRGGEQGRRIFRERFHTMTTIDNDSSSGEDQDEEARIIKENPLVLVKQASELLEDELDEMGSIDSDSTAQDALVALQVKLHSAKNDLLFVQGHHKMTLRGLHREVERLQKSVRELQFALITQGLTLVDEEAYQKRLRQLETSLNYWSTRCNYLRNQVTASNNQIVQLNYQMQRREDELDAMIQQRDRNIALLKRELELKSIEVEVLRQVTESPPALIDDRPPLKRAHSDVSRGSTDIRNCTPPQAPRTPQHRRKMLRLPLLVSRMLTMSAYKKKPPVANAAACTQQASPKSRQVAQARNKERA
ncbi:uncharacterized protein LOC111252648 isoform X1 [Varroa destructor]|uniref:CCDC92/74 N-terminal domain-containing protein n=2 Tax=Varroa destructor TaxID=109461 RepID=A0A7M7KGQ5_VARDE|nr:uncharacterized protein LOC111252648 isoform X1 [Varroa destructor]XP_022666603.1 uncharacterized protein LOC111252648 isoform X1 [Varroa destructor]XP_022666604.1 uncharacterized protein LOC111252648 isoform X1 [Varroa destructor]